MSDASGRGEPQGTASKLAPAAIAIAAVVVAALPYLAGAAMANGRHYLWLGENLDDGCVYLSWMRQAADGKLFGVDLFTTSPQPAVLIDPLFYLLGRAARLTNLPPMLLFHAARVAFGLILLAAVWRLIRTLVILERARLLSLLAVCFSAGLGWLPTWWSDPSQFSPIDKWQPEAITFQSLYLNPLFLAGMTLQVTAIGLLYYGIRSAKLKPAIGAGLAILTLGLVHTYDVVPVAGTAAIYLLFETAVGLRNGERRRVGLAWTGAILAGIIALPGALFIYKEIHDNPILRARADFETLSPPVQWVLLGYGLTLMLAVYAVWTLRPRSESKTACPSATALLVTWAVVNVGVAFLPASLFPFQRKMIQGAHLPIAILAGIGAAAIYERAGPLRRSLSFPTYAGLIVLLLGATNLRVIVRDIANDHVNVAQTGFHRPFVEPGEIEALQWIDHNTPSIATVQPLFRLALTPDGKVGVTDFTLACLAPGLTGHAVWCGHFGETPDFAEKTDQMLRFVQRWIGDDDRREIIENMDVRYLVFAQKAPDDRSADELFPFFRGLQPVPPFLKLVHSNPDADVYEVAYAPARGPVPASLPRLPDTLVPRWGRGRTANIVYDRRTSRTEQRSSRSAQPLSPSPARNERVGKGRTDS